MRSKLVPDFALTVHFWHLVFTSLYAGVPRSLFWWAVNAAAAALLTGLGIWVCRWRELKPISFGSITGTVPATGDAFGTDVESGRHMNGTVGDEGVGFIQGRRDGGPSGSYEMVDRSDRV
jgi:protein SYS1